LHKLAKALAARSATSLCASSPRTLIIASSCFNTSLVCVSAMARNKSMPTLRASGYLEFATAKTPRILAFTSAGVASAFHKLVIASAAAAALDLSSPVSMTLTIASSCATASLLCVSAMAPQKAHVPWLKAAEFALQIIALTSSEVVSFATTSAKVLAAA